VAKPTDHKYLMEWILRLITPSNQHNIFNAVILLHKIIAK